MAWAAENGIALNSIDFVATFEAWDNGIAVWVYYETREDQKVGRESGLHYLIEKKILGELQFSGYPFTEFPNVLFEFDSHENVVRNYGGSKFYRMRSPRAGRATNAA